MSKKIKIFSIVILGIALLIFISNYFGGPKTPPTTNTLSSSQSPIGSIPLNQQPGINLTSSNEFNAALSSIKTIEIDTSIFSNQAYKTLRDYPVNLGTDVIGRINPFAPVGSDPVTSESSQSSQIQTLQPAKITNTTAEFAAQASFSSSNGSTSVVFEYGTSELFGSVTTPVNLSKSGTAISKSSGLVSGATYYVRAVLIQENETVIGNTMTFITSGTTQ